MVIWEGRADVGEAAMKGPEPCGRRNRENWRWVTSELLPSLLVPMDPCNASFLCKPFEAWAYHLAHHPTHANFCMCFCGSFPAEVLERGDTLPDPPSGAARSDKKHLALPPQLLQGPRQKWRSLKIR